MPSFLRFSREELTSQRVRDGFVQLERHLLYEMSNIVETANLLNISAFPSRRTGCRPDSYRPSMCMVGIGALARQLKDRSVAIDDWTMNGDALHEERQDSYQLLAA